MDNWASLGGGYGNVDMQAPLPIGKTDNTGALGIIGQLLMRQGSRMLQQGQPQGHNPDDELEMARMLGLALGRVGQGSPQGAPAQPSYASLGMRGV